MIITIDGYAGSGKTTAARHLAEALGYELLNTGAMYRATAWLLERAGFDLYREPRDSNAITALIADYHFELHGNRVSVNGTDLTPFVFTEAQGKAASRVGTFLEVRRKLQAEQRRIADDRNVITEGRDQGTSVFPHAPVKFFFTASAETRARRRIVQESLDENLLNEMIQQITARDKQDEDRDIDPLRQADDAHLIDTSIIDQTAVLERMMEIVTQCLSNQ